MLTGKRRSVFVQQLRKQPASLLESFDLPAMNPNCLQRAESLVAPQALHLLNDATIRTLAAQFADRVRREVGDDPVQQVRQAYLVALSRSPSADEQTACVETLRQLTDEWSKHSPATGPPAKPEAARQALATFCHTLMNSAAFLYID